MPRTHTIPPALPSVEGAARVELKARERQEMCNTFARTVWRRMMRLGLNADQVSKKTDGAVSRDRMSKYLNAKSMPDPRTLVALAAALECEPAALLPGGAASLDLPDEAPAAAAVSPLPAFTMSPGANGRARVQVNMELPMSVAIEIMRLVDANGAE